MKPKVLVQASSKSCLGLASGGSTDSTFPICRSDRQCIYRQSSKVNILNNHQNNLWFDPTVAKTYRDCSLATANEWESEEGGSNEHLFHWNFFWKDYLFCSSYHNSFYHLRFIPNSSLRPESFPYSSNSSP